MMKRRKMWLSLLLVWMVAAGIQASEQMVLTIHLADQSKAQFMLPDDHPYVAFGSGYMIVRYTDGYLDFTPGEVKNITIDPVDVTEVEEVKSSEERIAFDLRRAGVVHVSGLRQGDQILVVAIDGKNMQVPIDRKDGEATIDLSCQPRGCYVVSVNKSFTFKLMKP